MTSSTFSRGAWCKHFYTGSRNDVLVIKLRFYKWLHVIGHIQTDLSLPGILDTSK